MNNYDVCAAWYDAFEGKNWPLESQVAAEGASRGLNLNDCTQAVKERRAKVGLAIGAAVLIGVAAALAAKRGGGGGYAGTGTSFQPVDSQWDWDLINNPSGFGSIWVCRGVQTGQFSEQHLCAGRLMNDGRWPGLGDPFKR